MLYFAFVPVYLATLKKATKNRLIPLLSLLLLLQGLLPVQLHTTLVRDDNGRLLEICTLEGIQTLVVNERGELVSDFIKDNERSAAIAFSQLMTEALPDVAEPLLIHSLFIALHYSQPSVLSVPSTPSGLLPIRAPPAA